MTRTLTHRCEICGKTSGNHNDFVAVSETYYPTGETAPPKGPGHRYGHFA